MPHSLPRMSTPLATELTQRQIGRREASKPAKVTGRLKRALDLMVWDGKRDNDAAVETGMTVTAIRLALQRPHVRAYFREQMDVFRARESPRNIHRLCEIRDAANNMPAVNAVKALEQLGDGANGNSAGGAMRSPGITIVVQGNAEVRETPPQPVEIVEANHCLQMVSDDQ